MGAWAPQEEVNRYIKSQTILGELSENENLFIEKMNQLEFLCHINKTTNWLIKYFPIVFIVQQSHRIQTTQQMDLDSGIGENIGQVS